MAQHFTCDLTTVKSIGTYEFKYSEDVIINHNFFEIIIQNTINDQKYKLFYSKYNYTNKNNNKFNGTYYSIVNIIPIDATTNIFGLYDTIMSAGVYIYKIIEYKKQCNINDKDREIPLPGTFTCYTFIGDFMTDVWPLNEIKKDKLN